MPSDTPETTDATSPQGPDAPARRDYDQPPSVGGLALSFFATFFALRGLTGLVFRDEALNQVAVVMPIGLTAALIIVLNLSRAFRQRLGVDATEASLKRQKVAMIIAAVGGAITGAVFGITGMTLG